MSRVGIVGDLHLPFTHPAYLRFCQDTFDAWRVDKIVVIGDVVDHHRLSFHQQDPAGHSAELEADLAFTGVQKWYAAFPKALVCVGNHDERHYRVARSVGVPDRYVREYSDLWGTKSWSWQMFHEIDDVLYEHGTGSSGRDAAFIRAKDKRRSLVMGHVHTGGGVKWHTNERSRIFGLNVGCGIDCKSYAFAYGRPFPTRPTLGCGIVIDGTFAYFEPMPLEQSRYKR